MHDTLTGGGLGKKVVDGSRLTGLEMVKYVCFACTLGGGEKYVLLSCGCKSSSAELRLPDLAISSMCAVKEIGSLDGCLFGWRLNSSRFSKDFKI